MDDYPQFQWNSFSSKALVLINNEDERKVEANLISSLNLGCQTFFVTTSVILHFLILHRKVQEKSFSRNAVKFLIVLATEEDSNVIQNVIKSPSTDRK